MSISSNSSRKELKKKFVLNKQNQTQSLNSSNSSISGNSSTTKLTKRMSLQHNTLNEKQESIISKLDKKLLKNDYKFKFNSLYSKEKNYSNNSIDLNCSEEENNLFLPENELVKSEKRKSSSRKASQLFVIGDEGLAMQFDEGNKQRLSSFFSTSSNEETIITVEESITEEEMVENLKTHRQIIENTKKQHWPIHRKLKILHKAKQYLKKHEGDMKQSSQARDILATYRTYIEKGFRRLKREIDNLIVILTPWEMRIKKIESQFGSVVASYFTFLRWIFWINTFVGLSYVAFVMVPEVILLEHRNTNSSRGLRKLKEEVDKPFLSTISDINEFEGFLKFSPIFYGYYDTDDDENMNSDFYYPLPLLYFVLTLLLFLFSFFIILRKMAKNAKLQRIVTKEEFTFCWKLYTGWDYMIGNSETAHNKFAAIVMSLKEIILEEKEKKKEIRNWKLILKRIIANLLTLIILCSSAYAVVLVVEKSQKTEAQNFFQRNEVNFVFAGLQFVCPHLFTMVAMLEDNHPRIALRWQLGRILILNILNFICLLFSTFVKVHSQTRQLKEIKDNLTLLYTLEMEENCSLDSNLFVTQTVLVGSVTLNAIIREKRQEGEGRLFPPSYNDSNIIVDNETNFNLDKTTETLSNVYEEHLEGRLIKSRNKIVNQFKNQTIPITTQESIIFDLNSTIKSSLNFSRIKPFKSKTTLVTIKTLSKTTNKFLNSKFTTIPSLNKSIDKMNTIISLNSSLQNQTTDESNIFDLNDNTTNTNQTEQKTFLNVTNLFTTLTPNCTQLGNIQIDPFKLFEFAQQLEKEGFQNYTTILKGLCWETSFGQELVKLTLTDLYMTIVTTIFADYLRAVAVRYCNGWPCCCFDLEMTFPGYADFQIAENILSLTNSQGMIWLGMFFAPGLPIINTIKLYIMMYFKSWAVLTSNIPHETVFKASGNNNFYYFLLLLMLFLACLPVAYCLVWFEPSWHCGPYSNYHNIYHILTKKFEQKLPNTINRVIDYISSPALIIPLLMFLILIIYYMTTILSSLKDANSDLKAQLRKDRNGHNKLEPMSFNISNQNHEIKKQVRIEEPIITDELKQNKLFRNCEQVNNSINIDKNYDKLQNS